MSEALERKMQIKGNLILKREKKKMETKQLNQAIQILEAEYKVKSEELQKDFDLKSKALKLEQDREQEEYHYKTKREREISNNQ